MIHRIGISAFVATLLLSLGQWSQSFAGEAADDVLRRVDAAIDESDVFERQKLSSIDALRNQLRQTNRHSAERFLLNNALFAQYESLVCDSALHYLSENETLAEELRNDEWLTRTRISKALVYSKAGLFNEALDILRSLDPSKMSREVKAEYYHCYNDLYQFLIEYEGGGELTQRYRRYTDQFKDSVKMYEDPSSFGYLLAEASGLSDQNRFTEAIAVMVPRLGDYESGTREYSILCSIIAFCYRMLGDTENEIYYYGESAISDIHGVVKENMAMRALAEATFARGDLKRANAYIQKSIDDANYFSARMRKNQSALMLPLVSDALGVSQEHHRQTLMMFIIIISLLAVSLVVALMFLRRQLKLSRRNHKAVSEANTKLEAVNSELVEANDAVNAINGELTEASRLKEEYIARFLELCSNYISTLESYRKTLYRQATSGQMDELYKSLKSQKFINDTLVDFYESFDSAFLNIFPDFLERINALLTSEGQIELRSDEKLNTELRILALIRLGINDSQKIARFLRCSITTVYTYRSKLKNRAIDPAGFEDAVMRVSLR